MLNSMFVCLFVFLLFIQLVHLFHQYISCHLIIFNNKLSLSLFLSRKTIICLDGLTEYTIPSLDQFIENPHPSTFIKDASQKKGGAQIRLRTNYPYITTKLPSILFTAIDQLDNTGDYLQQLKTMAMDPTISGLIRQAHESSPNDYGFYHFDVKSQLSKQLQHPDLYKYIEIYENKLPAQYGRGATVKFAPPHLRIMQPAMIPLQLAIIHQMDKHFKLPQDDQSQTKQQSTEQQPTKNRQTKQQRTKEQ